MSTIHLDGTTARVDNGPGRVLLTITGPRGGSTRLYVMVPISAADLGRALIQNALVAAEQEPVS